MNVFERIRGSVDSWYLPVMLSLWCFAPGVRRIVDWQFGRNKLNFLSILPLISLVPLAIFVYQNASSPRVKMPFKALSYLWLFGFVYALVVALASGSRAGALFDFANFCVPMLVGAWIIMRPTSRAACFEQLSTTLLWIGLIECVYGLYQFVAPPPWDVQYVNDVNQVSLGIPEPFGLHPFAMLNGHGTLAVFLVVAILFNLHRLELRRPIPVLISVLCVAVLILTNVRSGYLALVIGIGVYMLLTPQRGKALAALGVVGVISCILLFNASTLFGRPEITAHLTERIGTLGKADEDPSVNGRKSESTVALHEGLAEPLGQGLGTVGQGVFLESQSDSKVSQVVLDNGYVARFLEMGVPGALFYAGSLLFGIICGVRAYQLAVATKNVSFQQIAVAGLAVQCALAGLDLSSDMHSSFAGVIFWIAVGISLRYEDGDELQRPAWDRSDESVPRSKGPLWA